jgi:hypothetical protein
VYRGLVTRLFYGLHLPSSYYAPAMRILREMGCVEVVARGAGRYTESEIVLYDAPTPEAYEKAVQVLGMDLSDGERRARALRKAGR